MNKPSKKTEKEILGDLYLLSNNIEDDLEVNFEDPTAGYSSYEESHNAVVKYTLKVLNELIEKWEKRLSDKD